MVSKKRLLLVILFMALLTSVVQAEVPRPTINIVGSYFYNMANGSLDLSNLIINQAQYLDGSTSSTEPIVGATFAINGLYFLGMDAVTGEALFTDGTVVASKDGVTFFTADLVNVRLNEEGFGDFGNINIGFNESNITNLVFTPGTGSQFVDEFAGLIEPDYVPDEGAAQFSLRLLFPFGEAPATFEDNFYVSSVGSVLAVFDGAPVVPVEPPVILEFDGDPLLSPVNGVVSFWATYTDADGENDSQTATWDFGDGTIVGPEDLIDCSPTQEHIYTETGIYTVNLTITDLPGNTATATLVVVVFDPAAGFTTGGGWFIPDSESYIDGVPVTDTKSKANFGFVVKYKKGADILDGPDGHLEFMYKKGDINLNSLDMEWLVIQSEKDVRFKGLATINGEGLYSFKVSGRDNGDPGTLDEFKIEIWPGEVDTENTTLTSKHTAKGVLGGGNIKIHQ